MRTRIVRRVMLERLASSWIAHLLLWVVLGLAIPLCGQEAEPAKVPPASPAPAVTEAERKSLAASLKALKAEDVAGLVRDAETGDAKAQWMLGQAYAEGKVVAKDLAKSWSWFQKSAEKSWPVGQTAVGRAYMRGEGVERNEVEGAAWFRKAAAQGYAQAQARLGAAYYRGDGVPRDAGEAIGWFRRAAEQDNPLGQFFLGIAYEEGQGVAKDVVEAERWVRKAADQAEPAAEYQIGQYYDYGVGLRQDHAEAASWYQKAAEQDLPEAQFDLAIAYHNGDGVHKSMDDAEKWFTKASEAGWAPASFYLGRMYADKKFQTSPQTGAVALKFLEKSAEQGYPLGAFALADIYSSRMVAYHLWASTDDTKACRWLLVARELSKKDRWESSMPADSATVRKELPGRISKMEKKLKGEFPSCEQSAAEWMKAHPTK